MGQNRGRAAGLCATHGLTDEGADRLRTALAATHQAPLPHYRAPDTLFHLTLAELAGSYSLTAQYAAVRATVNDRLDCVAPPERNPERSQRQHVSTSARQHTVLVDAVLDGDAEAARGRA